MADNTTLNAGSGGDTIASDDIAGIKFQRIKLIHGADGSNDGDVATVNPLPARLYLGTDAVTAGAGAVAAGTPRVTHASDDPAVTALQVIDDWDETDRCKVNIIVGQAGVTAGAGAVAASTPRVTLGSDDPAVVALQILDNAIAGSEMQVDIVSMPAVDTELTTADLDTGAGTDTRAVVGLVGSASGGGQLIPGSSTDGLLVNLGANNDVTVTGSVTANAGTNLNTSALALEAGGNLAGAATSLAILDDWDETDRCKVNPIAGQAGVAAGAGAVAATVQRMTLASDDPAVVALQIMDDWDNAASDGCSVSGDVAHDAADAGEPVKLGNKAIDLGANPTDVAANDRTNAYAMRNGVPFTIGGAPFVKSQNFQVTDADGAQTDTAILTAAANVAIIVTAIEVTADNANTVNVSVRIGFGTVNTPAADADKVILFHPGIAAGSGVVKGSGAGIIGAGLSNEDLRVTCADPVTGSISIVVTYFTLAIG